MWLRRGLWLINSMLFFTVFISTRCIKIIPAQQAIGFYKCKSAWRSTELYGFEKLLITQKDGLPYLEGVAFFNFTSA